MNTGKSIVYFKTLAQMGLSHTFFMKADDDAFLHLDNLGVYVQGLPVDGTYAGREGKEGFISY